MSTSIGDLRLNRDDHEPLYAQIATQFRARIASRLWPSGYRLRAEEDLAADLEVARGTLRRAIQVLVDDGLLVQVHGRGTFVTENRDVETASAVTLSSGERLARQGVYFKTRVLGREVVEDRPSVGPFAGGRVLRLRRLRSLAEGPDAVIQTEISLAVAPGAESITDADLTEAPLRQTLKDMFDITVARGERMYTAVLADEAAAQELAVSRGAPLLAFEEFSFTEIGQCVEHSSALVRTDHHPLAVQT